MAGDKQTRKLKNAAGSRRSLLLKGARDALPVGAGYFMVSFTLGIAMRSAGMTPLQGLICSLLNNASAGEYAGVSMIAAGASLSETALMILIANARYLLMSCALSQKLSPKTGLVPRLVIGFDVTDELFGLAMARPGFLEPEYYYGAILLVMPCWGFGTMAGVIAGEVLPGILLEVFSVALYIMFLSVIIPKSREDRAVAVVVTAGFALSFVSGTVPVLSSLSEGTRTILLTVVLAAGAAVLSPREEEETNGQEPQPKEEKAGKQKVPRRIRASRPAQTAPGR